MSPIPPEARHDVWIRDGGRCQRCGEPGTDVHHRVRRRDNPHHVPLMVLLCRECHAAVHAQPRRAKREGFIVSAFIPFEEAQDTPWTDWKGRQKYG